MKAPDWLPVYGQQEKGVQPTEAMEQVTFFNRLRTLYPDTYGLIAIHIRNEGKRTWHGVAKEKAEGLVTGASDIVIPGNPSLLIEMKSKSKQSRMSNEQIRYLIAAYNAGSVVCVAFGADAAMQAFNDWKNKQ